MRGDGVKNSSGALLTGTHAEKRASANGFVPARLLPEKEGRLDASVRMVVLPSTRWLSRDPSGPRRKQQCEPG